MADEKRLIYMDDTMDRLRAYADRKHQAGHTELANGILKAVNYIHNEISRVDAVEVVRCKECKNYEAGYVRQDHGWCKEWGTAVRAGGFCHHGERRTDGK